MAAGQFSKSHLRVLDRFFIRLVQAAELATRIAEQGAIDRGIIKVEQISDRCSIGLRRLQRLLDVYIGVRPKWIIQRYRLHEAAERIAVSQVDTWAEFALDLGYADQAHFIRDFKIFAGCDANNCVSMCSHLKEGSS